MSRALTLAQFAAMLQEEKLSVICARFGLQSCQFCDDLDCGDNTSPEAEERRRQSEKPGSDSQRPAQGGT